VHARGDSVPVFYAEDNYESAFPAAVRDFIDGHAEIRQALVDKTSGGVFVPSELAVGPSRAISVSFRDDPGNVGMFFFLSDIKSASLGVQPGQYRVEYSFDLDEPVDPEAYKIWKTQSIRRTALNRLDSVGREIALSSELGATYLTQSPFESQLLAMAGHSAEETDAVQAVNFLMANSPPLTITGPDQVLKLRRRNRRGFAHLQKVLVDAAIQLRGMDGEAFDARAQALLRTAIEPELRKAERRLSRFASHSAGALMSTSASLALAILTGGDLPLGALIGFVAAGTTANYLPAIAKYVHDRQSPEHILWKLLGRTRC
jgi:hypothetical protein